MKLTVRQWIGVSLVAGTLGLAYGVGPALIAQEAGKEAAKAEKSEKGKGAKKGEAKSDNRLPTNWGNIGLTDDQKKKVYAIQDQYDKEIKDLQKKLTELKAKQLSESEAVLTATQKQLLQEHSDAAKKKAADKKKDATKGEAAKPKSEKAS